MSTKSPEPPLSRGFQTQISCDDTGHIALVPRVLQQALHPALLLMTQGEGLEAALCTLLRAAPLNLSIMTRAARTVFFGSSVPCPPSPQHTVRPATSWLPPERSMATMGAQGWTGCVRTQIPLQGGKCQKMNEKPGLCFQHLLLPSAAFDQGIFWAIPSPLLTCPRALPVPSQTLWSAHKYGLHHPSETSLASGGGWVGKNTSQSSWGFGGCGWGKMDEQLREWDSHSYREANMFRAQQNHTPQQGQHGP